MNSFKWVYHTRMAAPEIRNKGSLQNSIRNFLFNSWPSTPLRSPVSKESPSSSHLLSFQMKYGMSLGRWIVCRDDNSSHHPTTTIEMPIILQKNFWRSMPMGDGTVTYLVVPELYRNTLNHPQTKSTTTDYEMWKSSAGQLLLFVFIPQF